MRFEYFLPCEVLRPFIKTFVIQETEDEKQYKVIPGTFLVIGFQYKGKLSLIENGNPISLAFSGVTGLTDRLKIFKSSRNIGSVLVYFKEMGATTFFKQPLHELFRESISLENFMLCSELLVIEEKLCEAKTDERRINIVERFLISKMTPVKIDQLVFAALALIHKNKGNIRITDLAKQLNTSQSPLEKRFRQSVGTSPKKFSAIVRLKHVIQGFSLEKSLTQLGYEAGFYDQAHFIKEFKIFTGDTPAAFLTPENT